SAASPGPTVTTVSKEGRRKLRSVKGRSILETLRENGIYISALCSGEEPAESAESRWQKVRSRFPRKTGDSLRRRNWRRDSAWPARHIRRMTARSILPPAQESRSSISLPALRKGHRSSQILRRTQLCPLPGLPGGHGMRKRRAPEEQEERERSFRQNMTRQWTSGQQL